MSSKKPTSAQAVALHGLLASLPQNPPQGYRNSWNGKALEVFFYRNPHCGEFHRIHPDGTIERY